MKKAMSIVKAIIGAPFVAAALALHVALAAAFPLLLFWLMLSLDSVRDLAAPLLQLLQKLPFYAPYPSMQMPLQLLLWLFGSVTALGTVLGVVQAFIPYPQPQPYRRSWPSPKLQSPAKPSPNATPQQFAEALMGQVDLLCGATSALLKKEAEPEMVRLWERGERCYRSARDDYDFYHSGAVGKTAVALAALPLGLIGWLELALGCIVSFVISGLIAVLLYNFDLFRYAFGVDGLLCTLLTIGGALAGGIACLFFFGPNIRASIEPLLQSYAPLFRRSSSDLRQAHACHKEYFDTIEPLLNAAKGRHLVVQEMLRANAACHPISGLACFSSIMGGWESWLQDWTDSMNDRYGQLNASAQLADFRACAAAGGSWDEICSRYSRGTRTACRQFDAARAAQKREEAEARRREAERREAERRERELLAQYQQHTQELENQLTEEAQLQDQLMRQLEELERKL